MENIKIVIFVLLRILKMKRKNKLNDNIKFSEDLSNDLENIIIQLKEIFEKMNKNKEKLKSKIQKYLQN